MPQSRLPFDRSVSAKRFDSTMHETTRSQMANITEVAEAAGVSISTVSYALSGKRPVAPDTRRRIEDAVRDLGYSPNAGARMLAGRRTNIFALTEPLRRDTHAPTHMSFVLATAVAARRANYDILLLTDEEAQAGMRRVASS
jgi:DNA-binding LacI/PurR family transcriptional regulator